MELFTSVVLVVAVLALVGLGIAVLLLARRGSARTGKGFDEELNEIRAKAWDEGFDAGEYDVFMHDSSPDGWEHACVQNPYRKEKLK